MPGWNRRARGKELDKWNLFKHELKRAMLEYNLVSNLIQMYDIAWYFGKNRGVKLPIPTTTMQRWMNVDREMQKLIHWRGLVDKGELAFQISGNDIDIVGPPNLTREQIDQYKDPDFAGWIGVGIVVVIAAAVIAYIALLRDEISMVKQDYNELLGAANSRYCADPNSAICLAWMKKKDEQDYSSKVSVIASIKKALSKLGTYAAKGVGAGIMVAIPLLMIWFLAGRKEKK